MQAFLTSPDLDDADCLCWILHLKKIDFRDISAVFFICFVFLFYLICYYCSTQFPFLTMVHDLFIFGAQLEDSAFRDMLYRNFSYNSTDSGYGESLEASCVARCPRAHQWPPVTPALPPIKPLRSTVT